MSQPKYPRMVLTYKKFEISLSIFENCKWKINVMTKSFKSSL